MAKEQVADDTARDDTRDDEMREEGSKIGAIIYFGVGLLALGVIVYLTLSWILGSDESASQTDSAAVDLGITLNEIIGSPGTFTGERVVVSGEVSEVLSLEPAAFVIAGDPVGDPGEAIVLTEGALPSSDGVASDPASIDNAVVQVAGIVRELDRAEIEDFLGVELDNGALDGRENHPVILASGIDLSPRIPADVAAAEDSPGPTAGPIAIGNNDIIAANLDVLANRRVIIRTEVADILTPVAYVSGAEVLVLDVDAGVPLLQGANALVTGVVRPFDIIEVEAQLDMNLDDAIFAPYEGDPAVIADEVVILTPIDAILSRPAAFAGLSPTVLGEIGAVFGPNAFAVRDEELLVVTDALEEAPVEQASALATGQIMSFNLTEFEAELGIDLDDEAFAGWEGRPALIASEVEIFR